MARKSQKRYVGDGRCSSLSKEMRFQFLLQRVQRQTAVVQGCWKSVPYSRTTESRTPLSGWRLYRWYCWMRPVNADYSSKDDAGHFEIHADA